MNTMNILDLLRLRSAPWLLIVCSAIAILTIAASFRGEFLTDTLGGFLIGLGFSPGLQNVMTDVHTWMISAPRAEWFFWAAILLFVAAGLRYLVALYIRREADYEAVNASRQLGFAEAPVDRTRDYRSEEGQIRNIQRAQKASKKAWRRRRIIDRFEMRIQQRCVATISLALAIAVELRGEVVHSLSTLGVILGIAMLVACGLKEEDDSGPRGMTMGNRLKTLSIAFLGEVTLLLIWSLYVVLALPLFVIRTLLYEPPVEKSGS